MKKNHMLRTISTTPPQIVPMTSALFEPGAVGGGNAGNGGAQGGAAPSTAMLILIARGSTPIVLVVSATGRLLEPATAPG